MLYQLSHRGSSAGQAESLNVTEGQRRLFPGKHAHVHVHVTIYMYMHAQSHEQYPVLKQDELKTKQYWYMLQHPVYGQAYLHCMLTSQINKANKTNRMCM